MAFTYVTYITATSREERPVLPEQDCLDRLQGAQQGHYTEQAHDNHASPSAATRLTIS